MSIFQEHSIICLHQVFWRGGAHTEFSKKPHPIFSAHPAADRMGPLCTAIIKVAKRKGKWDLDEGMKNLMKLKQLEENWIAKDPIGSVSKDKSIVFLKKLLSQILML